MFFSQFKGISMIKGFINSLILFVSGVSISTLAFAADSLAAENMGASHPTWLNTFDWLHPVFSLQAGASLENINQDQTLSPVDLCSYHYKSDLSNSQFLGGFFIGSEIPLPNTSSWVLVGGLEYNSISQFKINGNLVQGADSVSADTYNYNYKLQSNQLLAIGKIYWNIKPRIHPFALLGLGGSNNRMHAFSTNVPPFYEFTPQYSHHSETSFSYAIGAGIDFNLNNNWRLGVAYQFTDLGEIKSSGGQIDTIHFSNTLHQSHLYANQVFASLTYIPFPIYL